MAFVIASIIRVHSSVVSSSLILFTQTMETKRSSNIGSYKSHMCKILEDGILHSNPREHIKSYTALTGWSLAETLCVSYEVRTEFYIPQDGILHSRRPQNLKSYIALTG
jgi:hypothetical protein